MTDWMDWTDEDFRELAFAVGGGDFLTDVLSPLPLGPCKECGEFAQEVSPGHWECGCFRRLRERAA